MLGTANSKRVALTTVMILLGTAAWSLAAAQTPITPFSGLFECEQTLEGDPMPANYLQKCKDELKNDKAAKDTPLSLKDEYSACTQKDEGARIYCIRLMRGFQGTNLQNFPTSGVCDASGCVNSFSDPATEAAAKEYVQAKEVMLENSGYVGKALVAESFAAAIGDKYASELKRLHEKYLSDVDAYCLPPMVDLHNTGAFFFNVDNFQKASSGFKVCGEVVSSSKKLIIAELNKLSPPQAGPGPGSNPGAPGTVLSLPLPLSDISVPDLIGRILNAILGIVGAIALLMFVWGGFSWIAAAGAPDKIAKAKQTITWAALGLIAIFGSYAILKLIVDTFS